MAKIKFDDIKLTSSSLAIVDLANAIIEKYRKQGMTLSLRQLYYQMVSLDAIENSQRSYKRVGNIISKARDAGLVDWDAIEDRNRDAYLPTAWSSPAEIVRAAARSFRVDRWQGQENYVEVMVEKDALSGVLMPLCSRYHVRFTANKGYSSASMMFEAGQRILDFILDSDSTYNQFYILYVGDHDPSGIDMTRDVQERVIKYSRLEEITAKYDNDARDYIHVERLALNWDQVELWKPPPNPAKQTDSRYKDYKQTFGTTKSWELDAVEPVELQRLVEDSILDKIDADQWDIVKDKENEMRAELARFADDYENREAVPA